MKLNNLVKYYIHTVCVCMGGGVSFTSLGIHMLCVLMLLKHTPSLHNFHFGSMPGSFCYPVPVLSNDKCVKPVLVCLSWPYRVFT